MITKKIWIISKYPWVAALSSLNPNGDTSWFSLSKSSGEANYPMGEVIDVIFNDISSRKEGRIYVLSNSTTLTVEVMYIPTAVSEWSDFVNVWRKACFNAYSHAYSRAYNCTSPEAPYLNVSPEGDIWLPLADPQAQMDVESNTDWLIE